ncbi:MAG: class II aldolase/adducin family protein, partial [Candidatus Eisenbacteria bacterium]|nr:class II aldolase/adducin family protein [Candidatus Eisenbacteria bacterium]
VTGVSKGFLTTDQVVVVNRQGKKLSGSGEPSSEIKMHLAIYEKRPDVKAVVHAHPPVATGFAVAGLPLAQCILPEVVLSLGAVPVAEYGTPSTAEVCDAILPHIQNADAFLLANHGAVTIGKDVFQAYYRMETVEHFAKILLTARLLGRVNVLTPAQVEKLVELRKQSGVTRKFPDCESCGYCESVGQAPGSMLPGGQTVSAAAASPQPGAAPTTKPATPAGSASKSPATPAGSASAMPVTPDEKRLRDIVTAVIKDMTQGR